jgi:hypothetical protein
LLSPEGGSTVTTLHQIRALHCDFSVTLGESCSGLLLLQPFPRGLIIVIAAALSGTIPLTSVQTLLVAHGFHGFIACALYLIRTAPTQCDDDQYQQ